MSESIPEDSDLELALEEIEESSIETTEEECIPCQAAVGCNYCDENGEWPKGRTCKMCDGTKKRK